MVLINLENKNVCSPYLWFLLSHLTFKNATKISSRFSVIR